MGFDGGIHGDRLKNAGLSAVRCRRGGAEDQGRVSAAWEGQARSGGG